MSHWLRRDYGFTKADWYSPYESLNSMPVPPDPNTLLEIQKASIKTANAAKAVELSQLNSFLAGLQNNYQNLGNEDEFFSLFLSKLNQGYAAFDGSFKPKPEVPEFLNSYENNLKDFVDMIAAYSGTKVPDNILAQIVDLQRRITGSEANFYAFRQRKAAFWEDISTWVMSLAGFSTITTGNFVDEMGKQLIADSMGFLQDSFIDAGKMPIGDGLLSVSMRVTNVASQKGNTSLLEELKRLFPEQAENISYGKNNWISVDVNPSISGFTNLIENVQNSIEDKITVKISDTFSDEIKNGLMVQAKSGSKQNLFNEQKRNLISQAEMLAWDSYLQTAVDFYNNFNYDEKVDGGSSDELNAYINWTFSKNLMDTVLGQNDVYLSSHGFSTLDQQMEEGGFHFELAPEVDSLKLLSTVGAYSIEQVN